jgi:uncharacterized protein involved in exopolysaccharide biosynthesis
VAAAYVRHNLDLKLKGAQDALVWLQEEAARLRAKVEQSAEAIQNYRIKAGMLGVQEQRQITAQKMMDFNKAYLEAQAQRLSVEAKLRELTQIAKDRPGARAIFTVADSALIQKTKADAADLQAERSKLLKVYKEGHPEIQKIDARLQQLDRQLDEEIQTMLRAVRTELQVARAREASLLEKVNQLTGEGQQLSEKETHFQSLQREHDSNLQLYEVVLKRMKETGVTGQLETNNVRVVQEARAPSAPVRPNKVRNLAVAVGAGLLLGVGLAFVADRFDLKVRTPDDVEQHGLAVIAIVPQFRVKRT